MSEKHTYPDGSARVGTPPFPKLSPMEEAAGKKEPEPVIEAQPEPVRKPGRPPKNQSTKEAAQ